MLEFKPRGLFSADYVFRTPSHELVVIEQSSWRDRAQFALQTLRYAMWREKAWSGDYVIDRADGTRFGRARRPRYFREKYELDLGGRTFQMRRKSAWSREFVIQDGEKLVGMIRPASTFSRRVLVTLPDEWPLQFQVFVFWLALVSWRRTQGTAAAGG